MPTDRERQIAEAEELLGQTTQRLGFAKGLFFGQVRNSGLPPYPTRETDPTAERMIAELREFCRASIDPVAIDRNAEIPPAVVRGLGNIGVLGACLPADCGGRQLSQTSYCRLMEILGGHCGGTALFVNAHHSIGPRAIVLFGTAEQQQRWLPPLATGEWISAFALTEPEAGSDAANVQTTATPTPDGRGFLLNGQKRWITNGGLAQVLTVMAKTPAEDGREKITAFVVTPPAPGFEVVEPRMQKCGVRGTATARLAFHNLFVPRENVLGPLGGGLKIALTVLDFGRTTFGASCTGAAKFCVEAAVRHAARRVQFGEPLGAFELVKEKLAAMHAGAFAMEAATYETAALIDVGAGDYMVETALLKVFATEELWRIINDTIQIHGGLAYFTDQPFERMMRDARINTIGEGANDVLRAFSALVGLRDVGLELKGILDALSHPLANLGRLGGFAGRRIESLFRGPEFTVAHSDLEPDAARFGSLVANFGSHVERLLRTYRESIVDRQYHLGRVANAAMELYVSACVLKRLDAALFALHDHNGHPPHFPTSPSTSHSASHFVVPANPADDLAAGRYYLASATRRIRANLSALWDNDDRSTTSLADSLLRQANGP